MITHFYSRIYSQILFDSSGKILEMRVMEIYSKDLITHIVRIKYSKLVNACVDFFKQRFSYGNFQFPPRTRNSCWVAKPKILDAQ